MIVTEIFKSIEGEGKRTGVLCTFVRFFGCNLQCSYCDSLYSVKAEFCDSYKNMSIDDIINVCISNKTPYITLTGGEPLLQKDCCDLISELIARGFEVNIETNGSIDISHIRKILIDRMCNMSNLFFTIDYKSISSGYNNYMLIDNFTKNLYNYDVVKFVVGNHEDLLKMKDICKTIRQFNKYCFIFVSPIFNEIDPVEIVDFLKDHDLFDIRLQLQLHKFIWDPEKRGV